MVLRITGLQPDRPELESWLHHLLAVMNLTTLFFLSGPQFHVVSKGGKKHAGEERGTRKRKLVKMKVGCVSVPLSDHPTQTAGRR